MHAIEAHHDDDVYMGAASCCQLLSRLTQAKSAFLKARELTVKGANEGAELSAGVLGARSR